MAIIYYPNRVYKGKVPAIDRVMAKRNPLMVTGAQNTTSGALDALIVPSTNWHLDSLAFTFSNTTARDFAAYVKNGRNVMENLNDYLWFHVDGTVPQCITLSEGFYSGTELAAELQAELNANAVYSAAGITFTVSYDASTGRYTITPSSGNIRYLNVNNAQVLSARDSIAGHLFGLNADTVFASNVISDTTVFGLDSESSFINEAGNSDLSYLHTQIHILSLDQAVHLTSNVGADVVVNYVVVYEEIV